MLLLAAIAAVSAPPPPPMHASVQANAGVRIERPVTASKEAWESPSAEQRREIIVRDGDGRPLLLRLVENQ